MCSVIFLHQTPTAGPFGVGIDFPGKFTADTLNSALASQGLLLLGVPDEKWGEADKAVVELNSGMTVEASELIALCRERLGGVKTPKTADFVDNLASSANGKVLKKDIRKAVLAKLTARDINAQ